MTGGSVSPGSPEGASRRLRGQPDSAPWPGGPVEAAEALRRGRYREAEQLYREALARSRSSVPIRRALAETLRLTGRYRAALAALGPPQVRLPVPADPRLVLERARIHLEIGEGPEARDLLHSVAEGDPSGAPATARMEASSLLGRLELRLGERSRGLARLEGVLDAYDRAPAGALDARTLTAVGQAAVALGFRSPGLFRDALRVFDQAAALDPFDPAPALAAGELLFRKFNTAEAGESLAAVLRNNPQHPPALVGMARLSARGTQGPGRGGAGSGAAPRDPLELALAVNPVFPPARALEVERLLERERHEEARSRALSALEATPEAPDVLAALAASHFLAGEMAEVKELEARFLASWPGDPRLHEGLATAAERRRLYREAVRHARRALLQAPQSAAAARLLGLNLLRLGEMTEGRATLERAFARDPFDALLKNNLDLLDQLDGFEIRSSPPFEIVLPAAEAALLGPYVEELATEALEAFGARYGFEPEGTIRVEMYDRSADFSVRTVGIPGIGAHGVCFGTTIAMESPSARPVSEYHWASTLWHELAHTVSMGMTENRVPRWFTEGLSMLEERRRFGDGPGLAFLLALRDGRLLDLADLNDGFVFPSYPGQVGVSYYHASLVLEQIEADHGFAAILGMLAAFREGLGTAEAVSAALGISLIELDHAVDASIKRRFGAAGRALGGRQRPPGAPAPAPDELAAEAAASPNDFLAQLRAGIAFFEAERDEEASAWLKRAAEIIPEYGGANGPFRFLAAIHERRGRQEEARRAREQYLLRFPAAYDDWLRLAEMRAAAANPEGAVRALVAAIEAYPMVVEPHERLAGIAAAQGLSALELRERQAVLATGPPDRAEALYRLAAAHARAGDRRAARRRVLEALEIAPTFEPALRLLLDLRREG